MATVKADIFNLALDALLLNKEVVNPDTDTTAYAKTLRKKWPIALPETIADLDLDRTSEMVTLELVEMNPVPLWAYAYKYPDNCAMIRRIESGFLVDNRATRVPFATGTFEGESVIFTNQPNAVASIQPSDLDFDTLNASGKMALALNLAMKSSFLITGKGATDLKKQLAEDYRFYKGKSQEFDRMENFIHSDPETESEYIAARME